MRGIYVLSGYPDYDRFIKCCDIVLRNMDFIEIGIPFSDPVADGPVIARAVNEVVGTVKVKDIINITKRLGKDKNIFYMTYSNIIYSYGIKRFSDEIKEHVKGVIIADLPNRMHDFFYSKGFEVPIVPFFTPESRENDLKDVLKYNPPFIYCIGVRGITGSTSNLDSPELIDNIKIIKDITKIPVVIGFGIKGKSEAKKALSIADGFVIGTEAVKRQGDMNEYEIFIKEMV